MSIFRFSELMTSTIYMKLSFFIQLWDDRRKRIQHDPAWNISGKMLDESLNLGNINDGLFQIGCSPQRLHFLKCLEVFYCQLKYKKCEYSTARYF